jgi:hypothetical protein
VWLGGENYSQRSAINPAATPSANVITAINVKPGFFSNIRAETQVLP